ncbi:hypothetical protein GCM10022630_09050 [Thermobifida alba]
MGGPLVAGASPLAPDPHLTQPVQFGEPHPEVVREAVRGRFKVARRTHMTHRYPLGTGKTSPMRTDGPRREKSRQSGMRPGVRPWSAGSGSPVPQWKRPRRRPLPARPAHS